jgi:hypothetical protein
MAQTLEEIKKIMRVRNPKKIRINYRRDMSPEENALRAAATISRFRNQEMNPNLRTFSERRYPEIRVLSDLLGIVRFFRYGKWYVDAFFFGEISVLLYRANVPVSEIKRLSGRSADTVYLFCWETFN